MDRQSAELAKHVPEKAAVSYTVKPPNRGHSGDTGHLSLVERLSSSRRFCFKPIRNCLKTKITLKSLLNIIF